MTPKQAISKAVKIAGSPYQLSKLIGDSHQRVMYWERTGKTAPTRCIAIEQATDGAVTRYDLRPDVFSVQP